MGEGQRVEVVPYAVKYYCDCGAEMESTGVMLMSDPPKFVHKCISCNTTASLKERYPLIRWEEK